MYKLSKKMRLIVGVLTIMSCVTFSACKKNNVVSTNQPKSEAVDSAKVEGKKNEQQAEEKKPEVKVEDKESKVYKFEKMIENKDKKIAFNTPWKTNGASNKSACIEGKGEEAAEEGIGQIFIKDLKSEQLVKYQLVNNTKQMSPKYVEWCSENNLFVIIGMGYGTVSMGGNLYLLNTGENKLLTIYETKDTKKQISAVKRNGDNLEMKVTVYEDDNLDKKHEEKWIINSFDEKLKSVMQIKDEKGKLIGNIN